MLFRSEIDDREIRARRRALKGSTTKFGGKKRKTKHRRNKNKHNKSKRIHRR